VFLGVLRVLRDCEGLAPSSQEVFDELRRVQRETQSTVQLARSPERNLLRNSQQYWKALDLLEDTRGEIHLTPFGTLVADGEVTRTEFAATVIKSLILPNYLRKETVDRGPRYYLNAIGKGEIQSIISLRIPTDADFPTTVRRVRETGIPQIAARKKVMRELLERPLQTRFRNNVLAASNSRCLLTGVHIELVLEAAHIKPVREEGNDRIENGVCLRSDLHSLFDANHLRIEPTGTVRLQPPASLERSYAELPHEVLLPEWMSRDLLAWRCKYYWP